MRVRLYEIALGYWQGRQAQERDNEIYGRDASYYYRYRRQDARLGRFWSVDPLARKYPWNSPYAFAENRLVDGVEWEGLEWQPLDNAGNPVPPTSSNIATYIWVGYERRRVEVAPRVGEMFMAEGGDRAYVKVRVPLSGTVHEAGLMIGGEGMRLYTTDPRTGGPVIREACIAPDDLGRLTQLSPEIQGMARELLLRSELELGIPLRITTGFRSIEEQNRLYAQGRTREELDAVGLRDIQARPDLLRVTNAIGGQSAHNYGLGFDVAGRGARPYEIEWEAVGTLGEQIGLEWGGRWRNFRDRPHFEYPGWRRLIQQSGSGYR